MPTLIFLENAMRTFSLFLILGALVLVGCGPTVPPIVPVSGTLTNKAGAPVKNAIVRVVSTSDELDAKYVATGTTDDEGKFTLSLQGDSQEGCCTGENKVQIMEGSEPDEVRQAYLGGDPRSVDRYRQSLGPRPADVYSRLTTTPLTITVTADQQEYPLTIDTK